MRPILSLDFAALRCLPFGLILVGILTTGCGQGTYDERMDSAAGRIADNAKKAEAGVLMDAFFPVSDSNGPKGLKFRLPTLFSKDSITTPPTTDPKAKLFAADIAGFCYTMERQLDDEGGKKVPVYCYLYAVDQASADQLHTEITTALGPIAPGAWTDAPAVNGLPLKTLQATGNSEFEPGGPLPSQVKAYSFTTGANQVVVVWRAATSAATKNKLFDAVDQSMKTAVADAPAPAPMP